MGREEGQIQAARTMMKNHGILEHSPYEVIEMALRQCRKPVVKFSGGKASLVVLKMAIEQDPDIMVCFNNTGVEIPGTVEYVHRIAKEWRLNFYETIPEENFWDIVKTHGWPHIRLRAKDRKGKKALPYCCYALKERPSTKFIKEHKIDCGITGIQAGESRNRTFLIGDFGQFYYAKSFKEWRAAPIALWTDKQVWEYIRKNSLPYNPNYDRGYRRTGCLPCTGYIHWEKTLARCDPKMLDLILKKKGTPGLLAFMELHEFDRTRQQCGGHA